MPFTHARLGNNFPAVFICFLWPTPLHIKHQQAVRPPSVPCVPNAAPSGNLVKTVVAVATVLGSETAELLGMQNSVSRGTGASRLAKHGRGWRQSGVNNHTLAKN